MQYCWEWEGEGDRNGKLLVVEVADQNWWCLCVEVFEADGSSSELEPEQPGAAVADIKTTLQSTVGSSIGVEISTDLFTSGGTNAKSEVYISGVSSWSFLASSNFSKTAILS